MVANRQYINPFHETLAEYVEQQESGEQRQELAELSHKTALARKRSGRVNPNYPMGMTRQEAFNAGYISVEELDDEELRTGRCRAANGRIPKLGAKTIGIPTELHDKIVQEHFKRSNEKLRSQLDVALATMVDIMQDDTCEPKDRMEAAKYLFERVAGKTPERVQVAVAKAPWEEVIGGGIARVSQAESRAARGYLDAEVVGPVEPTEFVEQTDFVEPDAPSYVVNPRPPGYEPFPESAEDRPSEPDEPGDGLDRPDEPEAPDASLAGAYNRTDRLYVDINADEPADERITRAPKVVDHTSPQSTSATAPPIETNGEISQILRDEVEAAKDLAMRRKAAKKRIQDAKKKRIIARATGQDAKVPKTIELTQTGNRIQFRLSE